MIPAQQRSYASWEDWCAILSDRFTTATSDYIRWEGNVPLIDDLASMNNIECTAEDTYVLATGQPWDDATTDTQITYIDTIADLYYWLEGQGRWKVTAAQLADDVFARRPDLLLPWEISARDVRHRLQEHADIVLLYAGKRISVEGRAWDSALRIDGDTDHGPWEDLTDKQRLLVANRTDFMYYLVRRAAVDAAKRLPGGPDHKKGNIL
ncbi:hypothetical protein [Actinobaculum sp. 352]|uniref:hypothetical protein n=1 Tax=Actinobaculum sp. 352 TaxID=2490946 RepID=UPI000F7EC244|nr:hypothetical protein [Actinobaculum sp. 352]RTE49619.1 hypothetical protein EKN07_06130 [Actinobaculum sp. 352]